MEVIESYSYNILPNVPEAKLFLALVIFAMALIGTYLEHKKLSNERK